MEVVLVRGKELERWLLSYVSVCIAVGEKPKYICIQMHTVHNILYMAWDVKDGRTFST